MSSPPGERPECTLSVPEIRDYDRINAELTQRLDEGHSLVRLAGAEGQRLLVARLSGNWKAVVDVEGRVGPEFAAEVNSPNLTIVCRGAAADGAASRLRAGCVLILGDAGAAIGYSQAGGTIVLGGSAGPRAGLGQRGGELVLLGDVGPLAAERQGGGRVFAFAERLGPYAERARRGGHLARLARQGDPLSGVHPADASFLRELGRSLHAWIAIPGSEP